jgi:hypothetical protein
LNEPARWKFSSFRYSSMPVCSLSVLEWSRGVTRVIPFKTAAAFSISSNVTSSSSCYLTSALAPTASTHSNGSPRFHASCP